MNDEELDRLIAQSTYRDSDVREISLGDVEADILEDIMESKSSTRLAVGSRSRRLVVGVAAVATLSIAALAGSLLVGGSSSQVDVAQAAWNPVPFKPTRKQVDALRASCDDMIGGNWRDLDGGKEVSAKSFEDSVIVTDFRGKVGTVAYFRGKRVLICMRRDDYLVLAPVELGSIGRPLPVGTALGLAVSFDDELTGLVVGNLPTGGASRWNARIEQPDAQDVVATVSASGRYVAWVNTVPQAHQSLTVSFSKNSDSADVRTIPVIAIDPPMLAFDSSTKDTKP